MQTGKTACKLPTFPLTRVPRGPYTHIEMSAAEFVLEGTDSRVMSGSPTAILDKDS